MRAQLETADGARILVSYYRVLQLNDALQQALATGGGTEFENHYFRTTPRFETGDRRYAWLNQTVFVGAGHLRPGLVVEYEVFRVT